jgi:quercetin dioxygenase-like cupin family protein
MTEANLETARLLAELVDYQSDAVVSRTLLARPTGTVTLFAFDKGQSLSEHTAPFDALVLGLDGDLEITVAGKRNRLASGDVLLMPANKPHAVQAVSRSKMLLIMIRG